MSNYVPLHLRDDAEAVESWQRLHDGIPPWMTQPIQDWVRTFAYASGPAGPQSRMKFIYGVQMIMRMETRYPTAYATHAADELIADLQRAPEVGLVIVDYALFHVGEYVGAPEYADRRADDLARILERSHSVWTVGSAGTGSYRLVRSDLAEAQDAGEHLVATTDRPGVHLAQAWSKIVGRDTDPNGAYDQAVRAVEAAAQPTVSPNDGSARLGKMAADIAAKPSKWTFCSGTWRPSKR